MRIAAIDQGTSSTRSLVANAGGALEITHSVEHRQFYPQAGWVEHDPEELIKNIQACANAAGMVDAIGIDNQGESCLAWDGRSKQALSRVIVWQDNRTIERIEALKAQGLEAETLSRAGLPLDSYFSASKLGWIIENNREAQVALARGDLRMGTTDAFFLDRLTDRFVTDVTTASRTSLMNLQTRQWDATLCDLFGVPIEVLPKIVTTTGDFGAIKTDCGLIPVTASVVDQQAALYGFGCRQAGDAKISFGTGAFALMVTGGQIHRVPEQGLLPTVAWQKSGEPPVYALDGGVYSASSAVNWAKSLGLFSELSQINAFNGPAAIESGLAFVPALCGLACPHWNQRARGVWLGLSLEHGPEHLVRAILEGVAFRAAEVVDAMNGCVELTGPVLIDGGMSANAYFVQFLADVLERKVCPAKVPELTGFGTALLAADYVGVKLGNSPEFTRYSPQKNRRKSVALFKQAIAISQNWNIPKQALGHLR